MKSGDTEAVPRFNIFRRFLSTGGQNFRFLVDFAVMVIVRPTTVLCRYRAACDSKRCRCYRRETMQVSRW